MGGGGGSNFSERADRGGGLNLAALSRRLYKVSFHSGEGADLLAGGFKLPLASTHFTDLFPPLSLLPEDIVYFNSSYLRSLISIFSSFPAPTFSIREFASFHPLSFSAPSLSAFSDFIFETMLGSKQIVIIRLYIVYGDPGHGKRTL